MLQTYKPKAGLLLSFLLLTVSSFGVFAAPSDETLLTGQALRHDTSPPLTVMLKNIEMRNAAD